MPRSLLRHSTCQDHVEVRQGGALLVPDIRR